MSETKSNSNTIPYYYPSDYDDVMKKLPDIIKDAERKAGEVLEPTIHEKRNVMNTIKKFLANKGRKVYGGTAINETIKLVNKNDAIYDDFTFLILNSIHQPQYLI